MLEKRLAVIQALLELGRGHAPGKRAVNVGLKVFVRAIVSGGFDEVLVGQIDNRDMVKSCGWSHDQAASFLMPSTN
jgi:hypothetical protein